MTVAYNPNDATQQAFLKAIAAGESNNATGNPYTEGLGNVNLSGAPTDVNGFPIWSGQGNSHAAGAYQFQPGTWSGIANQYGLNFSNPQDQNAGAWYLAQQNDPNLYTDLQSGNTGAVATALASTWPGGTQNFAANYSAASGLPIGQAGNVYANANPLNGAAQWLYGSTGAPMTSGPNSSVAGDAASSVAAYTSGWWAVIEQGLVVLIGLALLLVALAYMLSQSKTVQVAASTIAKVAA